MFRKQVPLRIRRQPRPARDRTDENPERSQRLDESGFRGPVLVRAFEQGDKLFGEALRSDTRDDLLTLPAALGFLRGREKVVWETRVAVYRRDQPTSDHGADEKRLTGIAILFALPIRPTVLLEQSDVARAKVSGRKVEEGPKMRCPGRRASGSPQNTSGDLLGSCDPIKYGIPLIIGEMWSKHRLQIAQVRHAGMERIRSLWDAPPPPAACDTA